MRDGDWGRNGDGRLDGDWQRDSDWQHVSDERWTVMDGGQRKRNSNSTAIDGLMVTTAMDDAMATQRRWMVDGDGRQWTAQWRLNGYGLDGDVRCDGDWWTAMDGLAAMDRNGRLVDGDGRCDGNSTAMDGATATQRQWTQRQWTARECSTVTWQGWTRRNGVSTTTMDRERNGDGRRWMARWQLGRWMTLRQLDGEGRRDGDSMAIDNEEQCERDGDVGAAGGGSNKGQCGIKT